MMSWLNHRFVKDTEPALSLKDRGFLLGDGLFETIYYDGSQLECATAHFQRLQKGLQLFQIPFSSSPEEIQPIIYELLNLNKLSDNPAGVRLTISRGPSERGLKIPSHCNPTFLIQCFPYQREKKSLRLGISRQIHPGFSALSAVKHLGYQLSLLGRLEAQEKGFDDVLFLNAKQEIVSSTCGNVFAIIEGEVVTPPLSSGCLPGIKRGSLIQSLTAKGIKVAIRPLKTADLLAKRSSLFITNSLIDIQWAESLNGNPLEIDDLTLDADLRIK